jgi:hypothetical protein
MVIQCVKNRHGEENETRVMKISKSSDKKNESKEAEQELSKPENDSVVMEEVPSSQAELDRKLEEELRKKALAQKLASGTRVSISGNNEQPVQDNNMQDMGVDGGLGKTEREVNNYECQDKNHVGMDDTTDDKINSDAFARKHEYITQQIQEGNEDGVTHTHESDSGTLAGEKNRGSQQSSSNYSDR